MIRSNHRGILLFLGVALFISTQVLAQSPLPATLQSRPLRVNEVDLTSCKEIGDSNAGSFTKFLWEEQDSLETEILNGIGSISLGRDLVNQNFDKGYGNFNFGFDVVPRRRVYPVNFGTVKDGIPVKDPRSEGKDPKSGYYIVDTYRTALSANLDTTSVLGSIRQIFNHVSIGDGVEFGLQVRRVRLRRSTMEVAQILEQTKDEQKDEYNQLNAATPLDPNKPVVEEKIEQGLGYLFNGIAAIYHTGQTIIQTIVKPYVNDPTGQLFFAGLFDAINLRQELFHIDANTALNLVPGDILSMLQYVTHGPGVGFGSGIFEGAVSLHQGYLTREVRVTRLEGNKIRLALVHYDGIGEQIAASMGIGITSLKPAWGRVNWAKFYQDEIRYNLDLSNAKAKAAFDLAAKQYKPDWSKLIEYSNSPQETGVEKEGVSVIGDGLKDANALTKGDDRGLQRTAQSRNATTSLEFIVFRRKAVGDKDSYKKCTTDFDQNGNPKATSCDYFTLSQKTRTRTIDIPKIIKRHDTDRVGCEAYASLNSEIDSKTGVNLHCFYQVDDLLPTAGNYDAYLDNVKTMTGILEPQLQPLYHDIQWFPFYNVIMGDLSSPSRSVARTHQALHIDLYMNREYTDLIFDSPDLQNKVQNGIAQVLVGKNPDGSMTTWGQIERRGKTNSQSCHYNPVYIDVLRGVRGHYVSCNDIYRRALEMWHTFVKIEKTDDVPKRLKIINDFFDAKGREPYVPLLFLLLGGDYQKQVNLGNLAMRFSYGAEDQKAAPSKTYDIGSNFDGLSQGYKPIPEFLGGDPSPGTARIFDVKACVLPDTLRNRDPKIYLTFSSTLKSTIPDQNGASVPFQLSGFVTKHEPNPLKKDTKEAEFKIPELEPTVFLKDGQNEYKYVVEFSNFSAANLKLGVDYNVYFNLEDRNIDYGNGEYEHFSELVRLYLNLKP